MRELPLVRGELGKRISELEKGSELQSALKELSAVRQLIEDAKAEHDCERIAFQDEKEDWFHQLEQALAGKAEAEEAGDVVARVQKEVWIFKLMKYKEGYKDGAQGKASRYPFEIRISCGYQGTLTSLASDATSLPDAPIAVIGATQDLPTSEVHERHNILWPQASLG